MATVGNPRRLLNFVRFITPRDRLGVPPCPPERHPQNIRGQLPTPG
jgi:hypothetical protein